MGITALDFNDGLRVGGTHSNQLSGFAQLRTPCWPKQTWNVDHHSFGSAGKKHMFGVDLFFPGGEDRIVSCLQCVQAKCVEPILALAYKRNLQCPYFLPADKHRYLPWNQQFAPEKGWLEDELSFWGVGHLSGANCLLRYTNFTTQETVAHLVYWNWPRDVGAFPNWLTQRC